MATISSSPSTIRKAIIPAAGQGARMSPFTLAVPKELAPLGSVPAIHRVIEEAASAGLDEIGVVLHPSKVLICRYLDAVADREPFRSLSITYLRQDDRTGLAGALLTARSFIEEEPFVVLLPDNLPLGAGHQLANLVEVARQRRCDVVAVVDVGHDQSGLFGDSGRIEQDELEPNLLRVRRIADRKKELLLVPPGQSVRRMVGRWVCRPHFLDYLDGHRPASGAEHDEVAAFQQLVQDHEVLGRVIPGPFFDIGRPEGYLAANAHLAHHG